MLKTIEQFVNEYGPGHVLSAVQLFPKKFGFEGQGSGEHVLLVLRRHWVTNLWWLFGGTLLAFVPVIWPFFPIVSALPERFLFVLTLLWCAFVLAFVFEEFLTWFFSVTIVTSERIIDIDFFGLLSKHVTVASITKVQDITYSQQGVFGAMFNFGDVIVQTASEIQTIECAKVPHPNRVVKILSELTSQKEQGDRE